MLRNLFLLGPLLFCFWPNHNVPFAGESEQPERKLEYLKERQQLHIELEAIQNRIKQLDDEYQDVLEASSTEPLPSDNGSAGSSRIEGTQSEPATSPDEPVDVSKVQLQIGPQIKLLGDGELGLKYFPDMQVTALQQNPTLKLILAATELPFTAHTKMYS